MAPLERAPDFGNVTWSYEAGVGMPLNGFIFTPKGSGAFDVEENATRLEVTATWTCTTGPACILDFDLREPSGEDYIQHGANTATVVVDHPADGRWQGILWPSLDGSVAYQVEARLSYHIVYA